MGIVGFAALIINLLMESVKQHFGYLFCFKKKIQELESEIGTLKDRKTRIQRMMDRARDNAEIIEDDVSNWLTKVQKMEDEVDKFLEDKVEENKCLCTDLTWRHRLGKEAEEKKASVIDLNHEGSQLMMSPVGQRASYPAELPLPSSEDYMIFNSRDSVFNGIMRALKDSEVNLIGVHGPGGAGKTTLVVEAANQAKKDGLFDEIVMAVVSKDANVIKIQEQLAPQLNLKYEQGDELRRAGRLWKRLIEGNKKILVIMDDVWQQLNMKEIGIPIADGDRGCKVLLTARIEGVCQKMEVQKEFSIGFLEGQEAWSLFKKKVGNFVVTQSVAEEVCKECGGLPVAIVAVGAALKGKPGHVWDDALNQLKNSTVQEIPGIGPKMYTSLKWSYDYLEHEDAKSCFLLCCLFPEDANIPIEDLVRYCMALRLLQHKDTLEKARSRVQTMVDLLKSFYLLLQGKDENYVKMHDVIRDVAISITNDRQEGQGQQWPNKQQFLVKHGVQKWPEEGTWNLYTAVSIMADKMDELPGDLQCPELHTLLLRPTELDDVPGSFFNGMKKLTVLRLDGLECVNMPLPSSFANLVNLRMLQISDCHLGDMGVIKNLKNNLEILILGAYNIKELAPEIGELTHLRLLDLEECDSLEGIPQGVISNLKCLEELYISQEFDQWEGSTTSNKEKSNISLAELKSLKQLTTLHIHIPGVTLLPNDLLFENLKKFRISVGGRFDSDYGQYSSRMLKLEGFHLNPEFNGLIHRAETLHLHKLEGLDSLFHGTHDWGFSNLKYLEVIDCHDLEYLLGKPERLSTELTEVVIKNCSRLKYLCSSLCAKRLQQLQKLSINNCEIMEAIVEIEKERDEEEPENMVIDFSQLRAIELEKLPKLISFCFETEKTTKENSPIAEQSLFNEKVVFSALKELHIDALPNTDIWDKQLVVANYFCQLKALTVRSCDKVVNVIPSNVLCQLKNLEDLTIDCCNSVKSLVEELNTEEISETAMDTVELPYLRKLSVWRLPNLTSIGLDCSHRILVCTSLTTLTIDQCDSIRNVFSSSVLGDLVHLERLCIRSCQNMDVIVSNEGKEGEGCVINFPQLSFLQLEELPNLKSFCCSKFEAQILFDHQVVFPALKELHIDALSNTDIWDKQLVVANYFCQLKALTVSSCDKVVNVIPSNMVCQLKNLEFLYIRQCNSVKSLIEGLNTEKISETAMDNVELSCLRYLYLWELPNLTSIGLDCFRRILVCTSLTSLTIDRCDSIRNVFSSSVLRELVQLKRLYVRSCQNLDMIVSVEGKEGEGCVVKFPRLSYLQLKALPNLKSFCCSNFEEKSLFNYQVVFSALKELHIDTLPNTDIWDKQLVVANYFCQLKALTVRSCDKVVNVIPSNVLCQLKNLEDLTIDCCNSVKSLVEELNTEEISETAMDTVELPCLRKLSVWRLPNLTSIGLDCSHRILVCTSLTTLTIDQCDSIRNVFSSSVLGDLVHLERLCLRSCQNMDVIVSNEGKEGEGCVINFPQLSFLQLEELPNLKSFCCSKFEAQILFDHQVVFPALKELHIDALPNTDIWDKQLVVAKYFCQLKALTIRSCDKVVNVIPSNMVCQLKNLENLSIYHCNSVKSLVKELNIEKISETAMVNVELPCLRNLDLSELPNLTSIGLDCSRRILVCTSLTSLTIDRCDSIRNVFSSSVLRELVQLKRLYVRSCQNLDMIVSIEGKEGEGCVVKFPQLSDLKLKALPSLKSFCCSNFEEKILFNNKVVFPALMKLCIGALPNTDIWEIFF